MHIKHHSQPLSGAQGPTPATPEVGFDASSIVLREAKRLHRAATSESLAVALPVLRRLIATSTLQGLSLPELHRQRNMVQRKHILRTLAVEAGFASWEDYSPVLVGMNAHELTHFDIVRRAAGYPNLWFSTHAEAHAHAQVHGGRVLPVGQQAVVILDMVGSHQP